MGFIEIVLYDGTFKNTLNTFDHAVKYKNIKNKDYVASPSQPVSNQLETNYWRPSGFISF